MDRRRIILLSGLAILLVVISLFWMFQGIGGGNRDFILRLRAGKLAALVTVAASIGVATVLFQTVAANRVLTPSIMGFDALYILLQTAMVASMGRAGMAGFFAIPRFLVEIGVMSLLAALLFGALLGRRGRDIPRTILTGVILGVMFRSMSGFLTRIMDPNEFAVVQAASFASFNHVDATLLPIAIVLTVAAIATALRLAPRLDVMALGREPAISLGLRFEAMVIGTLMLVAILVSVSTALVGPMAFFGLIVAGLAHGLTQSTRHAALLPTAALLASVLLVGGQWIFERVIGQAATLSVVIEFAGGIFFLYLLLKGRIR